VVAIIMFCMNYFVLMLPALKWWLGEIRNEETEKDQDIEWR